MTGTGERTALAGIMRLVEQAQTSRSRAQALADRAAFFLTIVAVVAGALTLVVWLALGATGAFAVERLVSVLVIACPHALGLAVPLVVAISTSLGAQSGLLVRDRRGLEEARNLTTVVFDKTGTLTRGEFRVVDVATDGGLTAHRGVAPCGGGRTRLRTHDCPGHRQERQGAHAERPEGRTVRGDSWARGSGGR